MTCAQSAACVHATGVLNTGGDTLMLPALPEKAKRFFKLGRSQTAMVDAF